jgi:hypothetical protein
MNSARTSAGIWGKNLKRRSKKAGQLKRKENGKVRLRENRSVK